jgi:hypothetical protein
MMKTRRFLWVRLARCFACLTSVAFLLLFVWGGTQPAMAQAQLVDLAAPTARTLRSIKTKLTLALTHSEINPMLRRERA